MPRLASPAGRPRRAERSPLRGLAGFVSAGASHNQRRPGRGGVRQGLVLGGIVHLEQTDFTEGPEPRPQRSRSKPGGWARCTFMFHPPSCVWAKTFFIKRGGGMRVGRAGGRSAVGKPPLRDGTWREAGGTVRGRFEDGSRTVRGLLGGGSAVRLGRRTPAMAWSLARGEREREGRSRASGDRGPSRRVGQRANRGIQ